MKSQRSTNLIVASVIATIASSCPSSVMAFQTAQALLSTRNKHHHYHHRSSCLKTTSKESTEQLNDENNNLMDNDDNDDEYAADDSWVLRQITFMGLSAAPKNNDDDDNESSKEGTPKNQNALDARNLSEFLMEIGACSVSITDSDADTDNEDPLFHEPSLTPCANDDALKKELEDDGEEETWAMIIPDLAAGRNLWKRCDVSAHFPSSLDVPSIIDAVRYTFHCPTTPRFKVDDVPDLDWIQHVQESWHPIVTKKSKFVLRFPWHDDAMVMKACQEMEMGKMQEEMKKKFSSGVKREGAVVHFEEDIDIDDDDGEGEADSVMNNSREYVQIQLEGGIAFGTGEHPTTQLCLDWVRDRVEKHLIENDDNDETLNFLDYGAGSGVLGIAAASVVRDHNNHSKRRSSSDDNVKSSINTIGVEIDADAIHIANDNAKKNSVSMQNYLPDIESCDGEALSVVLRAMQRKRNKGIIQLLPKELNQEGGMYYDLCAANILAAPLVGLAPVIANLVKSPGGEIGLSGVLATQGEKVVEAYEEFFEDVKVAGEDGGWVLITGKRR